MKDLSDWEARPLVEAFLRLKIAEGRKKVDTIEFMLELDIPGEQVERVLTNLGLKQVDW